MYDLPDNISFRDAAIKDLKKLDGSLRRIIIKQIIKVSKKPQAKSKGGYGIPLGNKSGNNLTGYLEIKLRDEGIRCIYKCVENDKACGMDVIIISIRQDEKVYREARKRIENPME